MRLRGLNTILLLFCFCDACKQLSAQEFRSNQQRLFTGLSHFQKITDTAGFISRLKSNCQLGGFFSGGSKESINYFKKLKLFGSREIFYLLEYDWHTGPNAGFPWKCQLLFNKNGKLLKVFSALRLDLVHIFPDSLAFLFGVSSTARGNGIHQVYRIRNGKPEQVFDGFRGNRPQTYSTGHFTTVNIPNELYHRFWDVNHDGYADITLYGKLRILEGNGQYEGKIIPVSYIFLYHPATGHFTEAIDYSKKYEYIYGKSWE